MSVKHRTEECTQKDNRAMLDDKAHLLLIELAGLWSGYQCKDDLTAVGFRKGAHRLIGSGGRQRWGISQGRPSRKRRRRGGEAWSGEEVGDVGEAQTDGLCVEAPPSGPPSPRGHSLQPAGHSRAGRPMIALTAAQPSGPPVP